MIPKGGVKTQTWQVDARKIDLKKIQEAASLLSVGKVIIFPTETVYGLAAARSQEEAVARIYELKQRPREKPLSWHLVDYDDLNAQGIKLSPLVKELSWRFLPGPITLIVPGEEGKSLGLRFPDHPVARIFIDAVGEPVLATSVNISGEEAMASGKRAARVFDGRVDLVLDCGVTRYGAESTVVDFTVSPPAILRRGPLADEVEQFLKQMNAENVNETERILFICSGNTCRSVMAVSWLDIEIKRRGLTNRISTHSCGTIATEGTPATCEAIQVVRELGAEVSGHQARSLTKKLLQDATRIFAMSAHHVDAIVDLDHDSTRKVTVLGIGDPLGYDLKVYKQALAEIQQKMRQYLPWLTE